jgi:ribosome biogenesis GTPase
MNDFRTLAALGWDEHFAALAATAPPTALPARVARVDRGLVTVVGERRAFRARPPDEPIAVGDWVLVEHDDADDLPAVVSVLPRRGAIARGATIEGTATGEQLVAANVDVVFVVHPLVAEPKLRRIERELVIVYDSGAVPVVVLNKADLAEVDPQVAVAAIATVAPGVDIVCASAITGQGVDELRGYASGHRTVALIGPSGAGKSTLVNALVGDEVQATGEVRAGDQRGRHTTTARELVELPGGGVLVDTPGLRAVALWESDEGLSRAFADIEALAASCRFSDCAHGTEPGCEVRTAIDRGDLDLARFESYQRLDAEVDHAARRREGRIASKAMRSLRKDR